MSKNALQLSIEGLRRLFFLIPSRPQIAQIEITNRCNFNCLMCQRFPLKVPIKDMNFDLYKKIIDKLDGIDEVILTGWGEPLMHPQILKMIKYAKSSGKDTSLTTNGSLLNISFAQKLLECGLNSISFSIDDIRAPKKGALGHPITTQVQNIQNFMKLRKNFTEQPNIILQATLHQGMQPKIIEVIKWGAKIGVNMVNINRLDVRFQSLKRPTLQQEKKFIEKIEIAGKKYQIQTEFRPHIAFSGLPRQIYKTIAPLMALGGKHCLRIYNYVYINLKGEVTPCCALPLWSVGNLLKDDLDRIWKSERFQEFRRHDFQRKICGKCDVLEIKQYVS